MTPTEFDILIYGTFTVIMTFAILHEVKQIMKFLKSKQQDFKEFSPNAIQMVIDERRRQVVDEGWSLEHDKRHKKNQLAYAAIHYALPETDGLFFPRNWDPDHNLRSSMNEEQRILTSICLLVSELDRIKSCGGTDEK